MKRLTKICMPALMLGAAVLAAPAVAQGETNASANGSAAAAAPAQPAQDANSAAIPAQSAANSATTTDQTAMNSQPSSNSNANASTSSSSSANGQMAMNTTGSAGDLSSIPDTQKKYSRAKKNADNQSEDQTTKQLNQKESSLNGASGGNAQ